MTPEQAESIALAASKVEYYKHVANYTPVNQRKVILAGYQAVIDAVTREVDTEYALRVLQQATPLTYDFTGKNTGQKCPPAAEDRADSTA